MPVFDLATLIRVLCTERVEFLLVGGIAAALQGAPVLTQDVDVVYRIEEENLDRLERALGQLAAVARGDPRQRLDKSHLRTRGHQLASTSAGPLDLLGAINEGLGYDELVDSTDELEVTGCRVRVLTLVRLIELKRQLGRPKDLAMLPVLEATLRERSRAG